MHSLFLVVPVAVFPPSPMHIVLPQISISPPPPESPVAVPYSPFSPPSQSDQLDTFRSVHLTPPPRLATFVKRPLSPLRPRDSYVPPSKGLERDRFDALLQASKERNALVGAKKAVDLRKEITLKAHKTKQGKDHFFSFTPSDMIIR